MGGSQLKQLKASLRENGILGPQKSKKQRKASSKDAQKRIQRNAALESIRERFNPFEAKAPARKNKFDIASSKPAKKTIERPGITRGLGEERRRATLLKEMQSRNKIGGMLDRRFGEDDPNMTPEQKAAERFAQQALRTSRKNDMFNLEDNSEEEVLLTHGGRALNLGDEGEEDGTKDDFDDEVEGSDADDFEAQNDRPRKRMRLDGEEAEEEEEEEAVQRRKSKHEVMQEVIAKSKMYKAARQAAKEDDDDLRIELDKGMGDFYDALRGHAPHQKQLPSPPGTDSEPIMDPSRAAMLAGKSREEAEKEYEANLRELKLEARSKPSKRTKTEEETAAEEKARLEDLERRRLKRMRGEAESSDEDEVEDQGADVDEEQDDAEVFGLQQPEARYMPQLDVEDEDEFVMDDIVASDSEAELGSNLSDEDSSELDEPQDDGDDDFINGLVLPQKPNKSIQISKASTQSSSMAFTFSCPQTLDELLETFSDVPTDALPTAVQRVRALYHKGLGSENQQKLAKFAGALVEYIVYSVNRTSEQQLSMSVVEQLIRHLHSMAKSQPHDIALVFRDHLRRFQGLEPSPLYAGDLIIFTAIATTFPTSDQWHPVVTPAMLIITRYLAQSRYETQQDLAKGIYLCSLAFRYQKHSDRYVPETINFIYRGIDMLAPNETGTQHMRLDTPSVIPYRHRITQRSADAPVKSLSFNLIRSEARDFDKDEISSFSSESLLQALLRLIVPTIGQTKLKSAFPDLIAPILNLLTDRLGMKANYVLLHSSTRELVKSITEAVKTARDAAVSSRRPLFLHNHRPLAIKMSYPAFQDDYNPERRYHDPDRERSELNKLKAEHKKERKGAMRELRKDANFMAREQLREKKARDEAYEKKFKRLVADIQGEEGREAKEYNREKAKRKGRF